MSRDATEAMALKIAYERLQYLGYRYSTADIGTTASEILLALDAKKNEVKK